MCEDVVDDLRKAELVLREDQEKSNTVDAGGNKGSGRRDVSTEHLALEKASQNGQHDLGPVLCGCQTEWIDVEAFRARSDLLTNDQAEEKAVAENLLQRTPRMFMTMDEEWAARDEALVQAVDQARKCSPAALVDD